MEQIIYGTSRITFKILYNGWKSSRLFSSLSLENHYTNELQFQNQVSSKVIPTYGILNAKNEKCENQVKIDDSQLIKMYKTMVRVNTMDNVLYESQRQGRISFYMTNYGEEAVQIGSAAALSKDDLIYAQYREAGVLIWRGFTYEDCVNQCYGNYLDTNKGRQMPVHYGAKHLNFVTISSPLTTQLPQASGAAYGLKQLGKKACVACYFGEGAASEGDFHAALNFASTLSCPIVFLCRNNGYAISTPSTQQYAGDGIAAQGIGYGIDVIRVDGNDIIAVYNATKFARDFATENKRPVLIEAMTYRIGHHSTSDDSTVYRDKKEIEHWTLLSPIGRLKKYLEEKNLWDQKKDENLIKECKTDILNTLKKCEKHKKPEMKHLFTDVYDNLTPNLKKQMNMLENHIFKYGDKYDVESYQK